MGGTWADPGFPFPVVGPDGTGVALDTMVCRGVGCSSKNLHLAVRSVVSRSGSRLRLDPDAPAVELLWDVETGALSTHDGASVAEALARVASAGGVEAWVAQNGAVLRQRFERLRAQADSGRRPRAAPPWKPGDRVLHSDLFPDFTPYVVVGGRIWTIHDAACPDPGCPCAETWLLLRSTGDEVETLEVVLDRSKPLGASKRGRELWRAIRADGELLELLEERRREVREAGAFVVASAYERARKERAPRRVSTEPSIPMSGYLHGGEVPASAIARAFEAAAALEAADAWVCLPPGWLVRADVSGAARATVWVATNGATESLEVFDDPDIAGECTTLSLAARIDVPYEDLRERCAHGWPLVGPGEVPVLLREGSEDDEEALRLPTPDEALVAVAVCVAFAEHEQAVHELVLRRERGEDVAPERWESEVALESGTIHVRLTAPDASAPWPEVERASDDEPLEEGEADEDAWDGADHEDDEDGADEGEEGPRERVRVAREAFVDWALTAGRPQAEVDLASELVAYVAEYVHAHEISGRWYAAHVVEGFLTRYAPRKVLLEDGQIEGTHAALEALGEWLVALEHLDEDEGRAWRDAVARAIPTYRATMRDSSNYGLAKGTFTEMLRAGVDIADPVAVSRHIEAMNRASAMIRPSSPAQPAPRDVRERSPHRWRPAEGEKPPLPTDPCPCGSGRRYKKCCKPR